MANTKSEKAIEAKKLYKSGMRLVDIAKKLGAEPGTVRRWKSTQNWDEDNSERSVLKSERSGSQSERFKKKKSGRPVPLEDGTEETLQNSELTERQRFFCIYYVRSFNATQSYQKAYGCTYESAMTRGSELLRNVKVKAEIERLKEIKRKQIAVSEPDVMEIQARVAFADMSGIIKIEDNIVLLENPEAIDWQLVKTVRNTKYGIEVVLKDSQRAIDWLDKHLAQRNEELEEEAYAIQITEVNAKEYESDMESAAAASEIHEQTRG